MSKIGLTKTFSKHFSHKSIRIKIVKNLLIGFQKNNYFNIGSKYI